MVNGSAGSIAKYIMERALTSQELNLFRSRPQRAKWYLAVHKPDVLFSSQIAATANTYPASAVMINDLFNSGDETLTKRNQTVWFGSAPGASDEGTMRLRLPVDTAGSLIHIAESGCAINRLNSGMYVSVIDDFRPMPIMNTYDRTASQWRMDWDIVYESHLENFGPIIRMGPPVAGFLDGGVFTVNFVGESTQFIDETLSTAVWTFPDGQTESRIGTVASPVTKTFINASPGGSYFNLAVTDSAGASWISRRLIYCFASRNDVPEVEFATLTGGITKSYSGGIRVFSNGNTDQFPDGAEILIFEEASYAGTAGSIGGNYPFRENIVYRGWIESDTVTVNPFSSNVSFQVGGLRSYLEKTQSKDLFLAYVTPPTGASEWIETKDLSIDRATVAWGKYRSNVMEITDVILASGLPMTGKIAFQDLSKGTLWGQITSNYGDKGVNGYVSVDLQGNLYATEDVLFSGLSAALPLAMTIQQQDRRDDVIINHPHYDVNSLVELYSIASTNYAGAKSPGADADGYFGTAFVHQRGLVVGEDVIAGQQLMTTWAGNMRAKFNNKYPDNQVPLSGYLKLDPVPQSRLMMSLSATENVRGITWDNQQFLGTELTITYDSTTGFPLTTIKMEKIVDGKGGSAITFEKIKPLPPSPPPPIPPPPPPQPITTGNGFGTAFVALTSGIARTLSLGAGTPVWEKISTGISGTIYDFILDPWNPADRCFVISSTGVWKGTNIKGTPVWTQLLTNANVTANCTGTFSYWTPKIQCSINSQNYLAAAAGTVASSWAYVYYIYSEDAGNTWNYKLVTSLNAVSGPTLYAGAFDIVPHTIGGSLTIYMAIYWAGNFVYRYHVWKSSDKGNTWANVKLTTIGHDPGITWPSLVNTPYKNNGAGNEVWVGFSSAIDNGIIWHTTNNFSSTTLIDLPGTVDDNTRIKRLGVEVYIGDNNQVAIWNENNNFYKASDATTFTQQSISGYVPGTHGAVAGAGGFPSNGQQYYIVTLNAYVFVSTDGGAIWLNKTGNLKSVLSNGTSIYSSRIYPGVIVPIWTE